MSQASEINFWYDNHPMSKEAERLSKMLIPPVGKCDTVEGEYLRAAMRINYDFGNNGFGCNNWSGALNLLQDLPYGPVRGAVEVLRPYSTGGPYCGDDDKTWTAITDLMECAVLFAQQGEGDGFKPNTVDMWDLSDPGWEGEDDGYDYDSYYDDRESDEDYGFYDDEIESEDYDGDMDEDE